MRKANLNKAITMNKITLGLFSSLIIVVLLLISFGGLIAIIWWVGLIFLFISIGLFLGGIATKVLGIIEIKKLFKDVNNLNKQNMLLLSVVFSTAAIFYIGELKKEQFPHDEEDVVEPINRN